MWTIKDAFSSSRKKGLSSVNSLEPWSFRSFVHFNVYDQNWFAISSVGIECCVTASSLVLGISTRLSFIIIGANSKNS